MHNISMRRRQDDAMGQSVADAATMTTHRVVGIFASDDVMYYHSNHCSKCRNNKSGRFFETKTKTSATSKSTWRHILYLKPLTATAAVEPSIRCSNNKLAHCTNKTNQRRRSDMSKRRTPFYLSTTGVVTRLISSVALLILLGSSCLSAPSVVHAQQQPTEMNLDIDFGTCRLYMAISDLNQNDNLDADPEYIRFLSYWTAQAIRDIRFIELPVVLQQNFQRYAAVPGNTGVENEISLAGVTPTSRPPAGRIQELEDICASTRLALGIALEEQMGGTDPPPTSSSTRQPTLAVRPTTSATKTPRPTTPQPPMTTLPPALFPTDPPLATLPPALLPTHPPLVTPTPGSQVPIYEPVSFTECRIFMAVADRSRDNQLDAGEYTQLINRIAGTSYDTFESMPNNVQQTFERLSTADGTIDIFGSRPGQTLSDEQSDYLEGVCQETEQAVIEALGVITDAPNSMPQPSIQQRPTSSPIFAPVGFPTITREPTPVPTSTNRVVTIPSAFLVSNTAGLATADLNGPQGELSTQGLSTAYSNMVQNVLNDLQGQAKRVAFANSTTIQDVNNNTQEEQDTYGASVARSPTGQRQLRTSSAVIFSKQHSHYMHRRRLVLTFVRSSPEIYTFVDTPCPANTTSNALQCQTAYANYEISITDDEDPQLVTNRLVTETQNAIEEGALQAQLELVEPNSTFTVLEASFPVTPPATRSPTRAPAPTSAPAPTGAVDGEDDDLSDDEILYIILGSVFGVVLMSLIAACLLVCGCYFTQRSSAGKTVPQRKLQSSTQQSQRQIRKQASWVEQKRSNFQNQEQVWTSQPTRTVEQFDDEEIGMDSSAVIESTGRNEDSTSAYGKFQILDAPEAPRDPPEEDNSDSSDSGSDNELGRPPPPPPPPPQQPQQQQQAPPPPALSPLQTDPLEAPSTALTSESMPGNEAASKPTKFAQPVQPVNQPPKKTRFFNLFRKSKTPSLRPTSSPRPASSPPQKHASSSHLSADTSKKADVSQSEAEKSEGFAELPAMGTGKDEEEIVVESQAPLPPPARTSDQDVAADEPTVQPVATSEAHAAADDDQGVSTKEQADKSEATSEAQPAKASEKSTQEESIEPESLVSRNEEPSDRSGTEESCDKSAKPGGGSVSKEKDEVSPATKKPPKENESADGKGSDEEVDDKATKGKEARAPAPIPKKPAGGSDSSSEEDSDSEDESKKKAPAPTPAPLGMGMIMTSQVATKKPPSNSSSDEDSSSDDENPKDKAVAAKKKPAPDSSSDEESTSDDDKPKKKGAPAKPAATQKPPPDSSGSSSDEDSSDEEDSKAVTTAPAPAMGMGMMMGAPPQKKKPSPDSSSNEDNSDKESAPLLAKVPAKKKPPHDSSSDEDSSDDESSAPPKKAVPAQNATMKKPPPDSSSDEDSSDDESSAPPKKATQATLAVKPADKKPPSDSSSDEDSSDESSAPPKKAAPTKPAVKKPPPDSSSDEDSSDDESSAPPKKAALATSSPAVKSPAKKPPPDSSSDEDSSDEESSAPPKKAALATSTPAVKPPAKKPPPDSSSDEDSSDDESSTPPKKAAPTKPAVKKPPPDSSSDEDSSDDESSAPPKKAALAISTPAVKPPAVKPPADSSSDEDSSDDDSSAPPPKKAAPAAPAAAPAEESVQRKNFLDDSDSDSESS